MVRNRGRITRTISSIQNRVNCSQPNVKILLINYLLFCYFSKRVNCFCSDFFISLFPARRKWFDLGFEDSRTTELERIFKIISVQQLNSCDHSHSCFNLEPKFPGSVLTATPCCLFLFLCRFGHSKITVINC